MRRILASLLLLAAVYFIAGCEEEVQRSGLPACEPPSELLLERGLKAGYRALALEQWGDAKSAFSEVLTTEPGHPEARAGLRLASTMPQNASHGLSHTGIVLGDHELQTQDRIDHDSMRLETRYKEHQLAKEIPKASKREARRFVRRTSKSRASLAGIDLLVLHTTDTISALESFVNAQFGAKPAHFVIDWDGAIYQTLDLERIATHTDDEALDARSIAVALVAPRSASAPPLPKEAKEVVRPMSQRIRIQGRLKRSWGYTQTQMSSLKHLIADLTRLLPDLSARLPGSGQVPLKALSPEERRSVKGVVGHLHLNPESFDPGPGFDWSLIK